MNTRKLSRKLFFSLYSTTLNISRTKIHSSCYSFHTQESLKLYNNVTLLTSNSRHRVYSTEKGSKDEDQDKSQTAENGGANLSNFKVFKDYDSPVILDVDEERRMLIENPELLQQIYSEEKKNQFFGVNLDRGKTGVFEVDELVTVLRNDNALNIVTIAIPPEFRYVDYMVIVSGRSFKHLYSMAEFVRKLFKKKRHESDRIPEIEGLHLSPEKPSNWLAMDLGNIALHIFLEPVRRQYDLETLWSVGKEYDDLYNAKDDDYISLLQQHTITSLDDLVPLDDSSKVKQNEYNTADSRHEKITFVTVPFHSDTLVKCHLREKFFDGLAPFEFDLVIFLKTIFQWSWF